MLGFMPLAHIPMLLGMLGALSSPAFRSYGLGIVLAVVGAGFGLFLVGSAIAVVTVLLRNRLEWQRTSAWH
jgi:hypothetical protein